MGAVCGIGQPVLYDRNTKESYKERERNYPAKPQNYLCVLEAHEHSREWEGRKDYNSTFPLPAKATRVSSFQFCNNG